MPLPNSLTSPILDANASILIRCIHNADKRVASLINAGLQDAQGVSQTQALIILYLDKYAQKRSVYQYMLGEVFGLSTPTLTASLKSLINKGLIIRERDAADGRYYRLLLTPEGMQLAQPCAHAFLAAETSLSSNLTEEEKDTLLRLLKKLQ